MLESKLPPPLRSVAALPWETQVCICAALHIHYISENNLLDVSSAGVSLIEFVLLICLFFFVIDLR